MSAKNMKRVDGIGSLTLEQRAELERLTSMPDDTIDTSDAPEFPDDHLGGAIRLNGRPLRDVMELYRARKTAITARIDRDVLEWLKSQGRGYQTRINAILRDAMQNDRHHRTG